MRRLRYQVAMSLDGYIAGPNGEVDWIPIDPDIDFGVIFSQFDTLFIGRRTSEAMMSADTGLMPGMKAFVFSTTLSQSDNPAVTIVSEKPADILERLRRIPGKDIWLIGGGSLFCSLADAGLVDTVEVAIVPVILGHGIPLAPCPSSRLNLKLIEHKIYNKTGIVSLEYAVPKPH